MTLFNFKKKPEPDLDYIGIYKIDYDNIKSIDDIKDLLKMDRLYIDLERIARNGYKRNNKELAKQYERVKPLFDKNLLIKIR